MRACCEATPGIQRTPGPHGITLMRHAQHGQANRVVEYLTELGDADIGPTNLPLTEDDAAPYPGRYEPEGAPGVVFLVAWHERGGIMFARDQRQLRFLMHLGDHAFSPSGAAAVRVEFDVQGGRATRMTVRDGDLRIRARRLS